MRRALTHPRYVLGALCGGAVAFGVTACGTDRHASASSTNATKAPLTIRVTIKNYAFVPAAVRVRTGGIITFRNADATAHTATAADNRSFDSGTIKPSATAPVRFTKPGRFAYYCAFHPYMKGTVLVTR